MNHQIFNYKRHQSLYQLRFNEVMNSTNRMCLHFTGTMGFGLMPQIKSESPWGLSHLTSAYTSAHLAAHVAAATSGGGVGAYGSPNNETSLHHISSSPSGNHHQQQQHSSALQDLQNPMSAASTGSPIQHQQ